MWIALLWSGGDLSAGNRLKSLVLVTLPEVLWVTSVKIFDKKDEKNGRKNFIGQR